MRSGGITAVAVKPVGVHNLTLVGPQVLPRNDTRVFLLHLKAEVAISESRPNSLGNGSVDQYVRVRTQYKE